MLFAAREGDEQRFEARGLPELELRGLDARRRGRADRRTEPTATSRRPCATCSSRSRTATRWRSSSSRRAVRRAARRRRAAAAQPPAHAQGRAAVPRARAPAARRRRSGCSRSSRRRTAARSRRCCAPRRRRASARTRCGAAEHAGLVVGARRRGSRCATRSCGPRSSRACRPASAGPHTSRSPRCSTTTSARTSARGISPPPRPGRTRRRRRARARGGASAAAAAATPPAAAGAGARGRAQRRHRVARRAGSSAAAAAAWHAGQPRRASTLLDRRRPLVADPRLRADVEHLRGEIQLRCGVLLDACDILMAGAAERRAARHAQGARDAAARPRGGGLGRRHAAHGRVRPPGRRAAAGRRSGDAGSWPTCSSASAASTRARRRSGCRSCRTSSPTPTSSTSRAGSSGPRPARRRSATRPRAEALLRRAIALARASGAVDKLTYVLLAYVLMGLLGGRFDVAAEAAEGLTLAREAGLPNAASTHLAMLAWFAAQCGKEDECRRVRRGRDRRPRAASGGAFANAIAEWGLGILELSRRRGGRGRRPPRGRRRPEPGAGHPYFALMSAPGSRRGVRARRSPGGRAQAASAMFARLRAARRADVGARARRALPRAPLPGPGARVAAALRLHADSDRPFDRARTQLAPRRAPPALRRPRRGARATCAPPLETFERLGAARWAERAREPRCARRRRDGDAPDPEPRCPCSRRRSCRSPGSSPTATRTARSPRGSSCRRGRSTRSCARSSPSRRLLPLRARAARPRQRSRRAACCARGSPAPGSRSCFATCGRCAATALQAALARTLGDPAARRGAPAPRSTAGYADAERQPGRRSPPAAEVAPSPRSCSTAARLAALVYDASLDDDPELVDAICAAADDRAGERAAPRRIAGAARRAAGLAAAHRRRGRRRAPAARAQPARRRAAAAGGARHAAAADPLRHPSRPLGGRGAASRAPSDELAQSLEELRELARGIHPAALDHGLPARSSRSRPLDGADGRDLRRPGAAAAAAGARRLLRGVRGARERRQVRRARRPRRSASGAPSAGVAIEIADDGVGGADPTRRLGAARARRSRRGAGRAPARHEPSREGTVITADLPCAPSGAQGGRIRSIVSQAAPGPA